MSDAALEPSGELRVTLSLDGEEAVFVLDRKTVRWLKAAAKKKSRRLPELPNHPSRPMNQLRGLVRLLVCQAAEGARRPGSDEADWLRLALGELRDGVHL